MRKAQQASLCSVRYGVVSRRASPFDGRAHIGTHVSAHQVRRTIIPVATISTTRRPHTHTCSHYRCCRCCWCWTWRRCSRWCGRCRIERIALVRLGEASAHGGVERVQDTTSQNEARLVYPTSYSHPSPHFTPFPHKYSTSIVTHYFGDNLFDNFNSIGWIIYSCIRDFIKFPLIFDTCNIPSLHISTNPRSFWTISTFL